MKELITKHADNEESRVNVTVHENALSKKNTLYAKVDRNVATLENLIATVHKNNPIVSETIVRMIATEFKIAITEKISQGQAVNIFDVGILFLTARGGVESTNPTPQDIPPLGLCFTPSEFAKDSISLVEINEANLANTNPVITEICDTFTGKTDWTLSIGKALEVRGSRLRIAGDKNKTGVYFAPALSTGEIDRDETKWKRVSRLSRNEPKTLSFYLPEGLASGTWFIIIRTSYVNGKRTAKTIHEVMSRKVVVSN